MRIFTLDEKYSVVCDTKSTRNGFKHIASLFRNGISIDDTKICYLNRTYEYFTYESVLVKIVTKKFTGTDKEKYLNVIKTFQ